MRVSVALCTYNGSAFVEEQLRSIVAQTRPVAEIVVCDDASTDSTVDVVKRVAAESPVPIRLVVNESNLGYRANFSQAISLCDGDIIFLSDHDDVWLPDKVERITGVFAGRPEVDLVFSDADLVHQDLSPVGYTIWQSIEFHERRRRMVLDGRFLRLLMNRNVVTGATAAIRARIRDLILPVPGKWVHDAWIATMVAATGTAAFVDAPLILYRQHGAQQLGGRRLTIPERFQLAKRMDAAFFLDLAADYQAAWDRLSAFPERIRYPGALDLIRGKVQHSRMRAGFKRHRLTYVPRAAAELLRGRYHLYSLGVLSAAQDFLL